MMEEPRRNLPTQVYMLRIGTGRALIYKIGCSGNPEKRRRMVGNERGTDAVLLAAYHFDWWAQSVESFWHYFFRPERIIPFPGSKTRELFTLTARDIRFFKKYNWILERAMANYDRAAGDFKHFHPLFQTARATECRARLDAKRQRQAA